VCTAYLAFLHTTKCHDSLLNLASGGEQAIKEGDYILSLLPINPIVFRMVG
jgi:hypothetical protein